MYHSVFDEGCHTHVMMRPIHFEIGETAVTVLSDEKYHKTAKDAIFEAREIILAKIAEDSFFKITYDSYPPSEDDSELIRRMCQASELSDVGPMAGVAGAVAVYAVECMVEAGASFAVIENGGDIALKIDREISVGLYSGDNVMKNIALKVKPQDGIFGICSSSGKIGPSVSFGTSSICTVISDNVILADCCATALGNMIKEGTQEELSSSLEKIASIEHIRGCIASANGLFGMAGDVPELIRRDVNPDGASRIVF